ncbi:EamA/RhaT family transporter [Desulfobacter hydrogenophilus]|uniref:DMT family transporter n=1 Tax=Desulfobacter hydrogenophilus TaxID=2291 RepID=A0A328FER1_9BACT|nr:DMT family transporter [Desulfobacter hydrogenophilus]NDY70855.1 DMT family transporter [Desulfobacter hydrogenophilus]QBH11626.1 DMT family transporter [Desulfobacter hydrogenophilus]RAM03171.1 EamA/RhaT family transporter [Desulfobacter hydrogenophilus]
MKNQKKAYFFALATVLLWSTVASAFKISLRYISVVELLFFSTIFSVIVLAIILILQQKTALLVQTSARDWARGVLFGAINPFVYYLVLLQAYDLLPAQQAQPLNYTWAITLSLLSVPLLGHRLGGRDYVAIALCYFGVYVISTSGEILSFSFENPMGIGLALGSTILWAVYWILNTRDNREPVVGLFINFTCSIPMIGLVFLFTGGSLKIPYHGLLGAAYVGCFEMGISFVLWLMAMKYTESTAKIANLIFLSPFLSLIFIHVLVGEDIRRSSFVGLVLIVGGLVIQNRGK